MLKQANSIAEEILILAKMFDCGVCWDFGHANLSGLSQSGEIEKIGGKGQNAHHRRRLHG